MPKTPLRHSSLVVVLLAGNVSSFACSASEEEAPGSAGQVGTAAAGGENEGNTGGQAGSSSSAVAGAMGALADALVDCDRASDFDCLCGDSTDDRCSAQADLRVSGANPDASCTTPEANSGSPCTRDCWAPCGFDRLGFKECTCEAGIYSNCACPTPSKFEGAELAPSCADLPFPEESMGLDTPSCASLDETFRGECIDIFDPPGVTGFACNVPWQVCSGIAPEDPGNPNRGCVCLPDIDDETGQFVEPMATFWRCGSTNGWFRRDSVD